MCIKNMKLRIGAHLVFVSDVEKSKTFYRDILGLNLVEENPHFTEYELSGGVLYVEEKNPGRAKGFESVRIGGPTGVVLAVDDIQEAVDHLKKHDVRIIVEPIEQTWGGWNAIFADFDGNEFILDDDKS